ncbi:MAG: cytochrome c oxidase subunit 3 family protein [Planctomycetes bacterium]|nr:cytochrome c oxidase subunit 3 family protein [Planctomycetota bacterium]
MIHAAEVIAGDGIPAQLHRGKFAMWLFLASEVMFFTGFIGAFIALYNATPTAASDARQLNANVALVNTIVLITSSLTMALAVAASKRGNRSRVRLFLVVTILLGATFLVIKAFEYKAKLEHGITPGTSTFFSAYYLLTGFHGLHVLGGIVALLWLAAISGRFTREYNVPVEVTGLYWHFVDVVWIFLFPVLYLIAPAG